MHRVSGECKAKVSPLPVVDLVLIERNMEAILCPTAPDCLMALPFCLKFTIRKSFLGLRLCLPCMFLQCGGDYRCPRPNSFPQKQRSGPWRLWFLRRRRKQRGNGQSRKWKRIGLYQGQFLAAERAWREKTGAWRTPWGPQHLEVETNRPVQGCRAPSVSRAGLGLC